MDYTTENATAPKEGVYGPYDAVGDEKIRRKKKKKSKKSSDSDRDEERRKKKKKPREDGEVRKSKKHSKRRSSDEEGVERERRKKSASRQHHGTGEHSEHHKSSKIVIPDAKIATRSQGGGVVEDTLNIRKFPPPSAAAHEDSFRAAPLQLEQISDSTDRDSPFEVEHTINVDGDGNDPDNDVSVITPLTAFEEVKLREDEPSPYRPPTTAFSGSSPNNLHRPKAMGQEGGDIDPQRMLSQITRRPMSRSSEEKKKRVSLPPGLFPIAETYEGQPQRASEKKSGKNGPGHFPVDENYDRGSCNSEKRLSYSSTGESYTERTSSAQDDAGDSGRRSSGKKGSGKEDGPAYFGSSERYTDENVLGSTEMSGDVESQHARPRRSGAFHMRRTGSVVPRQPGNLTNLDEQPAADRMSQVDQEQQNVLYVDASLRTIDNPKQLAPWYCSNWFKILVGLAVLGGIITAIVVPLTQRDNSGAEGSPYSSEQIASRRAQLQPVLAQVTNESVLTDASSPQNAAMEWIVTQDTISTMGEPGSEIDPILFQRYALAVFYYATRGQNWFSSDGWLDGRRDECSWQHLECVSGDVVSIDTGLRNNLDGVIPSEIKELTELRSLILRMNKISAISADIGELDNLVEVDLSSNEIGGTIPTEIYKLTSLRRLLLSENSFTGTISPLVTNIRGLTEFDLDLNKMSGLLTTEFQAFTDLGILVLSGNEFSGDFNSMFNGLNKLVVLLAMGNKFVGTLAPDIQSFSNLELLDLASTGIEGTIPTELGTLTNLKVLALNTLGLVGTIPTELGNMAALEAAYLDFNNFSGEVPLEMCSLPKLTDLRADARNYCACQSCSNFP